MSRLKKRTAKWSFLIMLLVYGTFYMVFFDPEKIYAKALEDLRDLAQGKAIAEENRLSQEEIVAGGERRNETLVLPKEDVAADDAQSAAVAPKAVLPDYRDISEVVYTSVDDDYFADALFIGDSRIVGMFEYGGLEETAAFYAETGMTIYRLLNTVVAKGEDGKEITIEEALTRQQFGKIYLMVGINELGTGTTETFLTKYAEVVSRIQELQPNAVIYIQGILKVTSDRSAKGDYITNEGIEEKNEGLSRIADNVRIYYLDVNPMVCDETGGLAPAYTFDGVHLRAQYIPLWKEYLKSHVVENVPE